ncbi:SDR family oxidoreductase [Corticimicrobacter populi]|uniref:NAD(P)-dependent oxidoreductase n=1 Tax=Corticimicrobacter populi TaxID=2175229 RepID=A0A2V1K2Q8_9BURK|nr:SDR family oxidoreductase [Corticimicrobacter populi]PWF25516.1 NAD(P)-dependent oxidoreductase [Corticimicrobacter populi]
MTIAVTGASGQLGRIVIEKLKQKVPADQIVALVRSPEKVQSLGVSARAADYAKPATLVPALAGVDTLLLISSSEVGQRAVQHANVIAAARQAGVKRIVYTSLLGADHSPLSLADEHRATEAELKSAGVPYTILRNGWYTENYLGALDAALAHGALIGSAGEGRIASATREDFAEAAVAALTGTGHEGATYELAGDHAWTLKDLAAEVSRQSGKQVVYQDLPEAEYAKALVGFGLPEGLAAAIASWDVGASRGALFSEDKTLSRLIGRPTTSLQQAVAQALAAR